MTEEEKLADKSAENYFGKPTELVELWKVKSYKDAFLAGLNKANEWHCVKDGDLPPLNKNVLVIHKWNRTPEVGKRINVFVNSSEWVWAMCCDRYRYTSDDKDVIAWKEIVLPKES